MCQSRGTKEGKLYHAELFARHQKVLPKWMSLYYEEPIELKYGSGRRVTDAQGKEYLDFFGGILTTISGYSVPEVVQAIKDQTDLMLHSSTLYLISPMVELAEKIVGLSGIPDAKVFFTTSGTEANDTALMLACAARNSNEILAIRNSYHGRSISALAVTGNRSYAATSLSPFAVSYLQGGSRLRGPLGGLSDAEYISRGVEDLKDVLETTTSGNVAALIAEPIQGVGGFTFAPDGYFAKIKSVLEAEGILFISDEVQTGWGRTGEHFWGYEAHGVLPDMITFAKGVGNGLSLAGVVGRAEIIDSLAASSISTFGGSPLAAAGGIANLNYILDHDLQANALKTGKLLRDLLESGTFDYPIVADIRGKGLMLGIEICEKNSTVPSPQLANAVQEAARRRALLIGKGGLQGNVLRIAPPLSITEEEVSEGVRSLIDAISDVSGYPGA